MIIFLIIFSAFVVSLCITISSDVYLKKHPYVPLFEEEKGKMSNAELKQNKMSNTIENIFGKMLIVSGLLLAMILISGITFLSRHTTFLSREPIIQEKAAIIYKAHNAEYENEYELLSDIEKFNKQSEYQTKFHHNPWTSWYFCKYYEEIGLIDYDADIKNVEYGKEITYKSEPN